MRRHMEPARPEIPIRKPRFSFAPDKARRWVNDSIGTLVAHGLSPLFPAGERFFIRSVLAHRDQIADPELLAEIRAFVAQEAVHTAAHLKYDAAVQAHYDLERMERDTDVVIRSAERVMQFLDRRVGGVRLLNAKQMALAATVALEHFTAVLGEQLLENPQMFAASDPEFAALWFWHAIEEIEHKAVAFDVFEAVGGTYRERIAAFLIATVMIYAVTTVFIARMMHRDGELLNPASVREILGFAFVEPGFFRASFKHYADYFRRDFHPWDNNNRALLAEFRARYSDLLGPAAAAG